MATSTNGSSNGNGYKSKASVKRGMEAAKNGAPAEVVAEEMAEKRITPEQFFANPKQEKSKPQIIELKELDIQHIDVKIVGKMGLIMNKWSQKAITQMQDKHAKAAKSKVREAREPEKEFHDATYIRGDGSYGFPAVAFKDAAVTACTSLKGYLTQTQARQAFHVESPDGDALVRIDGDAPVMRTDSVTVGMGAADLRYRPEFKNWSAVLRIRYNAGVLSASQIVNLINLAGFAVGVGEWRPERNGINGTFEVARGV